MRGLIRFAGWDPDEMPIYPRSPASRFTDEQIGEMIAMAADGASGVEIAKALGLKPAAIRSKCWALGVRLRRPTLKTRIRMIVSVTRRMRDEAAARGVTVQVLIRRVLDAVSSGDWFDELLSPMAPHSLGACATYEPAAGRAGRAAVADAGSSVAAASFAVVLLRTPQLSGCCARLG